MWARSFSVPVWITLGTVALLLGLVVGMMSLAPAATIEAAAPEVEPSTTTVYLPASADATLIASAYSSNVNNGGGSFLTISNRYFNGQLDEVRMFLVKFDLTPLPPDAIIDSAVMELTWNSCALPGTYPVPAVAYFVQSSWTEYGVTWNTRPAWASMGVTNQISCPSSGTSAWGLTSFATAWQADPAGNHGVAVVGSWGDSWDYYTSFNSRELYSPPRLAVTYHLPPCDLQLTKMREGSGPVLPGTQIVYGVDVTNHGPGLAQGVVYEDTLPSQVIFKSCDAPDGPCVYQPGAGPGGENLVRYTPPDMPMGRSHIMRITVQVAPGAAGQIVNRASVSSSTTDSNPANNSAVHTLTMQATATPTATRSPAPTATRTPTATRIPATGMRIYLPLVTRNPRLGPRIFSDDFEDGDLAGWTPNGGYWDNPGSFLRGGPSTGSAWNMRPESGSDLVYEGNVSLLQEGGAGLTFRSSADGRSSYDVQVYAAGDVFTIARRSPYAVLARYDTAIELGRFYHIKVVARGRRIEAYLDGVKRLEVQDSRYSSGRLGVVAYQGQAVFDDLGAWSLP